MVSAPVLKRTCPICGHVTKIPHCKSPYCQWRCCFACNTNGSPVIIGNCTYFVWKKE